MKLNTIVVLWLALLLGCTGTVTYINRKDDLIAAEKVSSLFYERLKSQDVDGTASLIASNQMSNEEKVNDLVRLVVFSNDKFGEIVSSDISKSESRVIDGPQPKGEYIIQYHNLRSKTATRETLKLQLINDSILIVGIDIQPASTRSNTPGN